MSVLTLECIEKTCTVVIRTMTFAACRQHDAIIKRVVEEGTRRQRIIQDCEEKRAEAFKKQNELLHADIAIDHERVRCSLRRGPNLSLLECCSELFIRIPQMTGRLTVPVYSVRGWYLI